MEKLEKAELVREKCGVSYEDAKAALDACADDVLDAIVWLERRGKTATRSASYATGAAQERPEAGLERAGQANMGESAGGRRRAGIGELVGQLMEWLRRACRAGLDSSFVAERHAARVLSMPVLVLVILVLFVWPATLPLLVVGLFFGFRYHFEGIGAVTVDVNDVMDRAAEGAESIRRDFADGRREDGTV